MDALALGLLVVPGDKEADRLGHVGVLIDRVQVIVGGQHLLDVWVKLFGIALPVVDHARVKRQRVAVRRGDLRGGQGLPGQRGCGGQQHRAQKARRGLNAEDAGEDAAKAVEIEVDRLGQRQGRGRDALQAHRHQKEDADADQEDHPALEEMQEPLGLLDPVTVDEDADHPDADRVHQHRQRRGRQEKHDLVPERPAIEDREEVGKAEDREEVAQAGTGLGHLKLVDAKVDHVAFQIDRHTGKADQPDADFGGHRLKEDGQLPVKDLRQRQHEDQMHHRQHVVAPAIPAEDGQDNAADPDDEGIGDDVRHPHHVAKRGKAQPRGQDHQPRPARPRRAGRRHPPQFAQEEVKRDQGDQRPVAVFRRRPGAEKRGEAKPEDRQRGHQKRHEKAKAHRTHPGRKRGGAVIRARAMGHLR